MKFSMHNWMRPEPIETTLERLYRLGYNGIEISGEPARYNTDEVRRLLEMIRALGGQVFCIVPSTVGKVKPLASPAEEWQWVVEGLKEVCQFAQENGLTPGVEPLNRFETYLINRHDQAMRLADELGFGLRVVLDAFHINIEEADPIGAIRKVGSRLLDFHVADNNRRPAGQGSYNWAEVIGALKEINYQGHLTAEFVLPIDRTPLATWGEKREGDMQFTAAELKFIQDHGSGLISAAEYDKATADNINYLKQYL
jgi:sugar phosphate isomerase/epimerase